MSTMLWVWLGIFIVSLVIEILIPGLVSLWFSVGSLASLILAIFLGDTLIWLQIIVFVLVSAAFVLLIRPVLLKNRKKNTLTNVDSLVGKVAFVTENIKPFEVGTVKLHGITWNAIIDDNDKEIERNQKVIIEDVKGNTLKVKLFVKEEE